MSEGFAPIDVRQLEELLRDEPFVVRLVVEDSVGSTNDVLRRLALDGAPQGTVVLAEHQTRARGRLGRSWHSPRGLGLFVSTLLRPSAPAAELTRWTLAAAVAACRACREACAREIAIKWPNDLVWGGRKLGGVLAEARGAGSDRSELIIGTGINVRHEPEDLPVESCGRATSLQQATGGTAPGREMLAASYLRELGWAIGELDAGRWDRVAREWERLAPGSFAQPVRVTPDQGAGRHYTGVTRGLDPVGALRVLRDDGEILSVRTAESVVPLEV